MWQALRQLESDCLRAIERYACANYEERCKRFYSSTENSKLRQNEEVLLLAQNFNQDFSALLKNSGSVVEAFYNQILLFHADQCNRKPIKPQVIDTINDLAVLKDTELFAYEYKNAAKQLCLCIFTDASNAIDYFTDNKRNLKGDMYSVVEGRTEKETLTYASAENPTSPRYAKPIFRGNVNELISASESTETNSNAWQYMLLLEQAEVCVVLPYLLTAFVINQDKRVGFFRDKNSIENLFIAKMDHEPRQSRDRKNIQRLTQLFTFSDSFELINLPLPKLDELVPYRFDYSKKARRCSMTIRTVFDLCVQIFQKSFLEGAICKDIANLKDMLKISTATDEDARDQILESIVAISEQLLDLKTGCFKPYTQSASGKNDEAEN